MTVQIDQIFTAEAEGVQAFLSKAGQGCYIPPYQRAYAWDRGNVDRLLEDVLSGLNHLMTRKQAISFLGTIIAIHDTNFVHVKPIFRTEVPPRVMTIIDGQQRISTFAMINIALHDQIRTLIRRFEKATGEEFEWAVEQSKEALAALWRSFVHEQATGTPPVYRYYPRVIRAMEDAWSRRQTQAIYASPIARLIWSYISHVDGSSTDPFEYKAPLVGGEPDPRHAAVADVYAHITNELRRIARNPDKYDFPDLQQLVQDAPYVEALWGFPASDAVVKYITERSDHRLYSHYVQLFRSLIFLKYFGNRVALTIVTTRTEDDAFDMFEALNTTGEPLTAYETFRPKIIEAEGLEHFEASPSFDSLKRIDRYLETFKKADDRQKATADMLIPFALAQTGEKLQKNLSDQRRYLRDNFAVDDQPLDEKRRAVASMANLAAFMQTGWNIALDDVPQLEDAPAFDDLTGFAFQALRNLKHNITIAALSRFYDELRGAQPEEREQKARDLSEAIQATTAFSMLWRGAKGGTENIDTLYRNLLRDGDPLSNIPPLSERVKTPKGESKGVVSLANYRRLLRERFLKEFPAKDDWVKAASRVPIYLHSGVVAKFLLIAASHDTQPDQKEPGLIERGRSGLAPTMNAAAWRADSMFSVEHVAPQSMSAGWDQDIYEPGNLAYDRLGNLTLLPSRANEYVSNRSPSHKLLLYRYFSSATDQDAKNVEAEFKPAGLAVSLAGEKVLGTSPYLPMCRAIASYKGPWDVAMIEKRSRRLAELAYDSIIGWLGNGN
ncbi:DUF262 domain-containing protein [Sphingomonas agri]|uniref:DUF262 domain-containing protein n=1 Tax=Sphingomonas agri TaxID=1813878 RepID=UPI00311D92F1